MPMYSALHIMQWFSDDVFTLDVFTLKVRQKFSDFLHFYESKQMSLTQALKWLLEQSSALKLIF